MCMWSKPAASIGPGNYCSGRRMAQSRCGWMIRFVVPSVLMLVALHPSPAQLHDWRFQGRFQAHGTHDPFSGNRAFVRRARFWADGFFLPKASTRFQYDFRTRTIWDLWGSYHPTGQLEIRMGRSWLPFVGDYTESPFFLDMIDFPAAGVLFPAREHGVFFVGGVGAAAYSINIVRGSGIQRDSNRWKDVFGHVKSPFFNDRLTLGFAHYEGRDGESGQLRTRRRVTGDFILEVHSLLTLKGSWLAGKDGEVSSRGWWSRGLVHVARKIDVVAEMNDFFRGTARARYLTWGANYYFPWGLTRLKFNHRYFFEPVSLSEFKLQLQIFLETKWRSRGRSKGR